MDERKKEDIPKAVIERLPRYLACLTGLEADGIRVTSSQELGRRTGLLPSQIRKDFAFFGEFGVRGLGYDTEVLISMIRRILGLERTWNVAFLGAGYLALALSRHQGLANYGFNIVAFFDDDPDLVGRKIDGFRIMGFSSIPKVARGVGIQIGVITLEGTEAQEGVDLLVKCGVKGIWNFAGTKLNVPSDVAVYHENLITGPLSLSYILNERISC